MWFEWSLMANLVYSIPMAGGMSTGYHWCKQVTVPANDVKPGDQSDLTQEDEDEGWHLHHTAQLQRSGKLFYIMPIMDSYFKI